MASSIHAEDRNGNGMAGKSAPLPMDAGPFGVDGWHGHGTNGADLQRPRRLSFNGSDMELSDLKGSNDQIRSNEKENAVDAKQALILLAIAGTLTVAIKLLLPFNFESYQKLASQSATMAGRVWQDFVERSVRLRHWVRLWNWQDVAPQAEKTAHVLYAAAFGLLLSSFTWYMIYLDSSIPGVNPPTPFSASKKRYRGGSTARERRFHLPYITALLSGVVAFLIFLFVSE